MKKEVYIFILVLGLIGGSVWWMQKDGDTPSSNNQGNTQSNVETVSKNNTAVVQNQETIPTDPSEGGKYLVITEWGVRFPIPDSLKGDIEHAVMEDPTTKIRSTRFTSKIVVAAGAENCVIGKNPWGGFTGGLHAYFVGHLEKEEALDNSENYEYVGEIENYHWYRSTYDGAPNCASFSTELDDEVDSLSDDLTESLKQLQAVRGATE